MVHIKDVVNWMTTQAELDDEERASRRTPPANGLELRKVALKTPLAKTDLIRDVLFVPTSMPAGDLLVKMQANRIHLAVVVDEYGGTDGLVSIEDLVEEIVGDIEDEHDEESAPMIVPTEDGGFIADARAPLEDMALRWAQGSISAIWSRRSTRWAVWCSTRPAAFRYAESWSRFPAAMSSKFSMPIPAGSNV
jgi:CBS domain containing-hemolysin-like protein